MSSLELGTPGDENVAQARFVCHGVLLDAVAGDFGGETVQPDECNNDG